MNKNSKIKLGYEVSPTSHKGDAELELPSEGTNELCIATAALLNTLRSCSEKVVNMFCNGLSTLGRPIGAIIDGKTASIELANQSIYLKLAMTKEANMRKHLAYVAKEFDEKVKNNEDIPESLIETDKLLLIQDNVSTTSEEEVLKLWAKLYTEEACKPGTISRKAIKLIETLDAKIADILENEIFPYCDQVGFYWGNSDNFNSIITAIDYGFLETSNLGRKGLYVDYPGIISFGNYNVFVHPGFDYASKNPGYRLTKPAIEIKQCLKQTNIDILDVISKTINDCTPNWLINDEIKNNMKFKKSIKNDEKFVVCNNEDVIVFPQNKQYKTIEDYRVYTMANIEFINNYKKYIKMAGN